MEIQEIRKQIDSYDNAMLEIIAKRFDLIKKELVPFKIKNNLGVRDRKREEELVKDKVEKFKKLGYGDPIFIKKLFTAIMDKSSDIQEKEMKVKRKEGENGN